MCSVCDNCTNGTHKNLHMEPAENFQCHNQLYGEFFASACGSNHTYVVLQLLQALGPADYINRAEFCIDFQNKLEDDNDNFGASLLARGNKSALE
ncbi:hypothetical protein C0J52_07894 [Blattella germanica]|nr:hypothetical protein C0J52_07894 [Blattella germanica]